MRGSLFATSPLAALGRILALGAVIAACPRDAAAVGVMPSAEVQPVEQRLAIAVGPQRVAIWSQVRFDGPGGDVGIVLPVLDGAAIDWGSRAFFESLEAATAPRVLPPEGAPAVCPGDEPEPLVHVAGDLATTPTLEPAELALLDDAAAVGAWAEVRGLTISPALDAALATSPPGGFFVARFTAPPGVSVTKALRAVTPAGPPTLPLVLSQAGASPMKAVLWAVGPGRASFDGTPVLLDEADLVFDVGAVSSNYDAVLASALSAQGGYRLEMSSHEALRDTIPAVSGGPDIESVIRTYYDRAAAIGDATRDPDTCTTQAAVVLGQSAVVGTACPRTDLGVAGGGAACTGDTVLLGQVDPELLRCGPLADDVAILLSDLEPDEAWLTRAVAILPSGAVGADSDVGLPGGARVDPIVRAQGVDLSGCGGGGQGGGAPTSGSGAGDFNGAGPGVVSGAGSGGTVDVPVYAYDGCACSGDYVVVGYEEAPADEAPDGYYADDDGCSGDTADVSGDGTYADSAPDDCSGETYEGGDTFGDEGCSCDTSEVDSGYDDGCSCDAADSGASDACSCDSSAPSGDGCFDDCAIKPQKRPRPLNRVVYVLLAFVVPLRRLSRPKKSAVNRGAPRAPLS